MSHPQRRRARSPPGPRPLIPFGSFQERTPIPAGMNLSNVFLSLDLEHSFLPTMRSPRAQFALVMPAAVIPHSVCCDSHEENVRELHHSHPTPHRVCSCAN